MRPNYEHKSDQPDGAADLDTRINYLFPIDVEKASDSDLWINSFELTDDDPRRLSKAANEATEAARDVIAKKRSPR